MNQPTFYIGTITEKPPTRDPRNNRRLLDNMRKFFKETKELRKKDNDLFRQRQTEVIAKQLGFS